MLRNFLADLRFEGALGLDELPFLRLAPRLLLLLVALPVKVVVKLLRLHVCLLQQVGGLEIQGLVASRLGGSGRRFIAITRVVAAGGLSLRGHGNCSHDGELLDR